jgi:hypothetical protein
MSVPIQTVPPDLNMIISADILEAICKRTIETILLCLEHSTKGIIYQIGPMPDLQAVLITSAIRDTETGEIHWGLGEASNYNKPGRSWLEYRDEPGRVQEAMAWCVEQQKSWTSDNPYEDMRSVRRQVYGEVEDFHHMEPVLVGKEDLYGSKVWALPYPSNWQGHPVWQDTNYVVAAIIKIHFLPYSLEQGDHATKVIKWLSRTLGTEMLSFHLREKFLQDQKELTRQRLESCNVLAHELRNSLMKLNFTFRTINAQIGLLREHWEMELRKLFPHLEDKKVILSRLAELLHMGIPQMDGSDELRRLAKKLLAESDQFTSSLFAPDHEDHWLAQKLRPKWERLLAETHYWDKDKEEIQSLLERLRRAIWIGMEVDLISQMDHLPQEMRMKWPRLIYTPFSIKKLSTLDDIIELLEEPALRLPHQRHNKRVFTYLRAMVKIIPEIEERINTVISNLRSGASPATDSHSSTHVLEEALAGSC